MTKQTTQNTTQKTLTGRNFTASIKPSWSSEKMEQFAKDMQGNATCYLITHDKDTNEDGVIVEPHTHILILYKTPRKIDTIANLLNVPNNFIEIVKNKQGILRYLTHADDKEKYQYEHTRVITNALVPYSDTLKATTLTDKQIAEYISSGRGMDLIGIVEPNKLRAIQSFVHFDNSNAILNELRQLRTEFNKLVSDITKIVSPLLATLDTTTDALKDGMQQIAGAITMATRRLK